MKTREAWKYTLLSAAVVLIIALSYPVLAGTTASAIPREQTVERAFADTSALIEAVKATDAKVEEIQVRVKWNNLSFRNEKEAEIFLQAIAVKAGVKGWTQEIHDGVHVYRGNSSGGADPEQEIYVSLYSPDGQNEITGGLGAIFRGKEDQVLFIKKMTLDSISLVTNRSELPQIISCVRGKYNGKLKIDLQKEKVSNLLTSLKGKVVERLEEETVLSYSAYSPLVNTVIKTNHRSMNLQVAMHYDTYMQRTMITAGIPIITAEY